jgi:hypothetical protein
MTGSDPADRTGRRIIDWLSAASSIGAKLDRAFEAALVVKG